MLTVANARTSWPQPAVAASTNPIATCASIAASADRPSLVKHLRRRYHDQRSTVTRLVLEGPPGKHAHSPTMGYALPLGHDWRCTNAWEVPILGNIVGAR